MSWVRGMLCVAVRVRGLYTSKKVGSHLLVYGTQITESGVCGMQVGFWG